MYIFQTGHGKGLAKAEIEALFTTQAIVDETEDGFVVSCSFNNAQKQLDLMGGIVRITEVLKEGPASMPLNFVEWLTTTIKENFKTEKKVKFGLSMHPKSEKVLKKILTESKRNLKNHFSHIRFTNKDFQNLSSVQAWHEGLLEKDAAEFHLFKSEKKWYLVKTLAIQNFEWYSHRDYDRPAKDAKSGMFPPKLAQILINLSGANMVYDPFCGSGTVLQEAWLMGKTAKGSDLNEAAVNASLRNLEWLKKEANLGGEIPKCEVMDATKIQATFFSELTTNEKSQIAIVSETFLGPVRGEIKKIQPEIENLYGRFFSNLKKVAPKDTIMVFTAPYHKIKNDRFFLPNLQNILNKYTEVISLSDHKRPSLFYERTDQFVCREIWKVRV